jgi:hypothetical protein
MWTLLETESTALTAAAEARFRELVGRVGWITFNTRPDVAYAHSILCKWVHTPTVGADQLLTRTLRYLQETRDYSLHYPRLGSGAFLGWADADFAGDHITSRSHSGIVFTFNGVAVAWVSKQQGTVSLSTMEAETRAASLCAQMAAGFRILLADFAAPRSSPTPIFEDNRAALLMASQGSGIRKVKHVLIKLHFLMELVQDGTVRVIDVDTNEQLADALTKPLVKETLAFLALRLLGMSPARA